MTVEDFRFESFLEIDPVTWDVGIGMNLVTAFNVTHRVVPQMIDRGWGRIVMASSVTGPVATNPGSTGYEPPRPVWRGLCGDSHWSSALSGSRPMRSRPGGSRPRRLPTAKLTTGGPRRSADRAGHMRSRKWSRSLHVAAQSYISGQSIVIDGGNTIQEIRMRADHR